MCFLCKSLWTIFIDIWVQQDEPSKLTSKNLCHDLLAFPLHFVTWVWLSPVNDWLDYELGINCCIFIIINKKIYGFFEFWQGSQNGDPIYMYIFTLVVEVLKILMTRRIVEFDAFKFHRNCHFVSSMTC